MASISVHCDAVVEHIDRASRAGRRTLVAIAGPPGSGKSTLADAVVSQLNQRAADSDHAALVPMDGFHLANEQLLRQNLLQRKGAPETFDVGGLHNLIVAVRNNPGDTPYPIFDRSYDRSLVDAGLLKSSTSVVVFEGNYLLLDAPIWNELPEWFDATVFLCTRLGTLEERLTDRWLGYGYSAGQAAEKVHVNDLKNARLVLERSVEAGLILEDSG